MKHLLQENLLLVAYVFIMFKFSWEMLFYESGNTGVSKMIEIGCLQVMKSKLTTILQCVTCFAHTCQLCAPTIEEVSLKRIFGVTAALC